MKIILSILLAGIAQAAYQGVTINVPTQHGSTAAAPNTAPYTAVGSFRIDWRIQNTSIGVVSHVIALGGGQVQCVYLASGTALNCAMSAEPGNPQVQIAISGQPDTVFRFRRDLANGQISLESWAPDGTSHVSSTATEPNTGTLNFGGQTSNVGYSLDSANTFTLNYIRWYSSAGALNAQPPIDTLPTTPYTGMLGDWEFEGTCSTTGTDPVGNMNISWAVSPTCAATNTYGPAAYLTAPPLTVRAGSTITLNGSNSWSLNGSPTLNIAWNQTTFTPYLNPSGPAYTSEASFSSHSSAAPLVTLPLAGSYHFAFQVCDTTPTCTLNNFTVGVVPTDSQNLVVVPDSNMSFLLGPLAMWGTSPWPWYDSVMKADADALFSAGGVPSAPPFGPTLGGTITVTLNSQAVTGSGTHFLTDFACNGSDSIVIYYPLQNSQTGARPYTVVSCSSDTAMVIRQWNTGGSGGYDIGGTQSGVMYAKVINSQTFGWTSTTTSWNYYDSVLALYRLYYRTGIDTYLTYARQLADNWYVFPLDGGRCYSNAGSYAPQGARSASVLGMMARAVDGHSERWLDSLPVGGGASISGVKAMVDSLFGLYVTAYFNPPYDPVDMVDPRETGYAIWFSVAYQALYDSSYQTQNHNAILGATKSLASHYHAGFGFTSNGQSGYGYSGTSYQGSFWLSVFPEKAMVAYAQATPADYTATLSLLVNSYGDFLTNHYFAGTCQGITYSGAYASCDVGRMPSNPVNGSPAGNITATNGSAAISGSGTAFTSNPPWQNNGQDYIGIPDGTGNYYMQHINSGGISSATALTTASTFAGTTGTTNSGSWGYAQACANGVGSPNVPQTTYSTLATPISACSPIAYGNGERAVAELTHEINGYLYIQTGNAYYKTVGDALFAAAYGCGTSTQGCLTGGTGLANSITGGGPGADAGAGNFGDLLTYVVDSQFARGKEFGSNAGAGHADTYLNYRLGGTAPAVNQTVYVGFNLASVPNAARVVATSYLANGQLSTTTCTSSPCAVTGDVRQGTMSVSLNYQTSGGTSLAVSSQSVAVPLTTGTSYMLTTASSAGGTISPASGLYSSGSVVSVSASANSGYTFPGFSGDLTGSTTPQNLTMSAAKSVTANFANGGITVTQAGTDAGSTTGSGPSVSTSATNHPAGTFLVATVRGGASGTVTLSNTAGDTWSHTTARTSGSGDVIQVFYTTTSGNSSDVVTATFGTPTCCFTIRVSQVTGLSSKSLDVDTGAPQTTSSTIISTAFTTTTAAEVIFMVTGTDSSGLSCTAGSGYTAIADSNGMSCTQYKVVSAIQSGATASLTVSASGNISVGAVASFK